MHVGREADDPLHVVAVDFAWRGPVVDGRDVRDQRPAGASGIARHHRQIGDVLDRRHLRLRNLDLNLEAVAASRIPPEVQIGVAARRCCGRQRPANVGSRDAELTGAIAIDLNLQGRIVERLRVLQVSQRGNLDELRPDFLGKGPRRRECGPLHRDFDRRRRAEAHDLADDVGRFKRHGNVRQRLLQVAAQLLFQRFGDCRRVRFQ